MDFIQKMNKSLQDSCDDHSFSSPPSSLSSSPASTFAASPHRRSSTADCTPVFMATCESLEGLETFEDCLEFNSQLCSKKKLCKPSIRRKVDADDRPTFFK